MVLAHDINDGHRTNDVKISCDVSFETMLLSQPTLQGLIKSGFYKPSPIQLYGIPFGKCGFDLLLEAKSGTGKTAVFTIIAIEKLDLSQGLQTIILTPTREIAAQICDVVKQIGQNYKGLNVAVVMGGLPFQEDICKLKENVHILVASPGRLRHLIESNHIAISGVRLFVLDEADKLMDRSFLTDINYIFSTLPKQKQVIMSSATYDKKSKAFIDKYIRGAQYICPDSNSIVLGIVQKVTLVKYNSNIIKQTQHKFQELLKILANDHFKQCLIFCNYQARVIEIHKMLTREKWPVEQLYGQQEQINRLDALKTLQEYKCRILVSTDLASRGIDVSNIDIVINFEPPYDWQTYLHRTGRTGRFGSYGVAITILSEGKEELKFKNMIQGMKLNVNITNLWTSKNFDLYDTQVPSSEVTNLCQSSTNLVEHEKIQNMKIDALAQNTKNSNVELFKEAMDGKKCLENDSYVNGSAIFKDTDIKESHVEFLNESCKGKQPIENDSYENESAILSDTIIEDSHIDFSKESDKESIVNDNSSVILADTNCSFINDQKINIGLFIEPNIQQYMRNDSDEKVTQMLTDSNSECVQSIIRKTFVSDDHLEKTVSIENFEVLLNSFEESVKNNYAENESQKTNNLDAKYNHSNEKNTQMLTDNNSECLPNIIRRTFVSDDCSEKTVSVDNFEELLNPFKELVKINSTRNEIQKTNNLDTKYNHIAILDLPFDISIESKNSTLDSSKLSSNNNQPTISAIDKGKKRSNSLKNINIQKNNFTHEGNSIKKNVAPNPILQVTHNKAKAAVPSVNQKTSKNERCNSKKYNTKRLDVLDGKVKLMANEISSGTCNTNMIKYPTDLKQELLHPNLEDVLNDNTQALIDAGLPTSFSSSKYRNNNERNKKRKEYKSLDTVTDNDSFPHCSNYKYDSDRRPVINKVRIEQKESINLTSENYLYHNKHAPAFSQSKSAHNTNRKCKREKQGQNKSDFNADDSDSCRLRYIEWYNKLKSNAKQIHYAVYANEMSKFSVIEDQ